jgi:hypothetical protein
VEIGIGLPNPVPNTEGSVLIEWAKRAETAGFSGLVTIDRIAYPSYDSLTTHAAAAGATERIKLMTNILLAPSIRLCFWRRRRPALTESLAAASHSVSQPADVKMISR